MCGTGDYQLRQGSTFTLTVKCGQPALAVKPVTGITGSGQAVVTAPGHGLTTDWPVWIVGVGGMSKINHRTEWVGDVAHAYQSYYVGSDTLRLNLDTTRFDPYSSGGEVLFYPPRDLTGYEARMQARVDVSDATPVLDLSSTAGDIVVGGANGVVRVVIPAAVTEALDFDQAYYSIEIVSPTGEVSAVMNGTLTLAREVTR